MSALNDLKYAITGVDKSSLAWASKVMNELGSRCGHEAVFAGPETIRSPKVEPHKPRGRRARIRHEAKVRRGEVRTEPVLFVGDASTHVVGHLDKLPEHVKVLHVVQHPMATINVSDFPQVGDAVDALGRSSELDNAAVLSLDNPLIDEKRLQAVYQYLTGDKATIKACKDAISKHGTGDLHVDFTVGWDDLTEHQLEVVTHYAQKYGYASPADIVSDDDDNISPDSDDSDEEE